MSFTLSFNPINHCALAEIRFFGDCYLIYKILLESEFVAKMVTVNNAHARAFNGPFRDYPGEPVRER